MPDSSEASASGRQEGSSPSNDNNSQSHVPSSLELPFLVTHWLANFNSDNLPAEGRDQSGDDQRLEAFSRLRRAAHEMATAFSELGAFGRFNPPHLTAASPPEFRNATYSDVVRRWSQVEPNHLQTLMESQLASTSATESSAQHQAPIQDFEQAAREYSSKANSSRSGGRRLGESTEAPSSSTRQDQDEETAALTAPSLLQPGYLLAPVPHSEPGTATKMSSLSVAAAKTDSHKELQVTIASDPGPLGEQSAQSMRHSLQCLEAARATNDELGSLQKSRSLQQEIKNQLLAEQGNQVPTGSEMETSERENDTFQERLHNCERVLHQLDRKMTEVTALKVRRQQELEQAQIQAKAQYDKLARAVHDYGDPFASRTIRSVFPSAWDLGAQRTLANVSRRQYGANGRLGRRFIGGTPRHGDVSVAGRAVLKSRFTHSITVNTHLSLPVFCIKFDQTGRYFATGADDGLVKLFCLGAGKSHVKGSLDGRVKVNMGANLLSAILVCTLRGHAGVICDIDVSSDNAFLATASGDGDVRVWGLKDGCPVAILRGHKGGANMVTWSTLTPYRLVTVAEDGFSRVWDIREAALKRYGAQVRKRKEYALPFENQSRTSRVEDVEPGATQAVAAAASDEAMVLPPLPLAGAAPDEGLMLPPLPVRDGNEIPAGQAAIAGEPVGQNAGVAPANIPEPGAFVANDELDEGVKLLAKHQHGEAILEQNVGVGTRSRQKPVRVICVARCPVGGHFVTGSDDGICRVWSDVEDDRVSRTDQRCLSFSSDTTVANQSMPTRASTEGRLLAKLVGHINAITDLSYSHAGDRILTASQKDGVVRLWKWAARLNSTFSDLKQVVIRLPRSHSGSSQSNPSRRRGGSATNGAGVVCDVAVWTSDDSKVITSQCCPVKESSTEIVPGTQFVLVWDSWTGQCLLGIPSAHTAQCQAIVPHPSDPSLFCTAGSDGFAKLWDIEKGDCIRTHENTLEFGCISQPSDRDNHCGYLEGCFSPDGMTLILSDDSGRFSIFSTLPSDSFGSNQNGKSPLNTTEKTPSTPAWLREQYFASDYYDLNYDRNGYCVERGSELPPHLAPRAARCSHTGSPWAEEINDTFHRLGGPSPITEDLCRRKRESIRSRSLCQSRASHPAFEQKRSIIMGEFDPERTILLSDPGSDVRRAETSSVSITTGSRNERATGNDQETRRVTPSRQRRGLSSNWNWLGYDEAEEGGNNEGDLADSDEEFVAPGGRTVDTDDEEVFDLLSDSSFEGRHTSARSRRRERRNQERDQLVQYDPPTRASSRRSAGHSRYAEVESDEESDEFHAVVSTNNAPSGPHVDDYKIHFFRLPEGAHVNRKWLGRVHSAKSYSGINDYAPQVGDSVIYVPQAHRETLERFPVLEAPWSNWTSGARWPLLRCRVEAIRFRFPFESFFRSRDPDQRCKSIVAILTLEVTGIPEVSRDRDLPWPIPVFHERVTRSGSETFEVHLFESNCAEFIFPEKLFCWRLKTLEDAFRQQNESFENLGFIAYSHNDTDHEDADMTAFGGRLLRCEGSFSRGDPFSGSGFNALRIEWDEPGWGIDSLSPWDVTLPDNLSEFEPPRLSRNSQQAITNAIKATRRLPAAKEWFSERVDQRYYSDYYNRIEVPMYLSLMEERSKAGYYSNDKSALADANLICTNCIKYNGPHADVSKEAEKVCEEFGKQLAIELENAASLPVEPEPDRYTEPENRTRARLRSSTEASAENERHSYERGRRSQRNGQERRNGSSSLERLPQPAGLPAIATESSNQRMRSRRATSGIDSLARSGSSRRNPSRRNEVESEPLDDQEQSSSHHSDGDSSNESSYERGDDRTRAVRARTLRRQRQRLSSEEEASDANDEESEDDFEAPASRRSNRSTRKLTLRLSDRHSRSNSRPARSRHFEMGDSDASSDFVEEDASSASSESEQESPRRSSSRRQPSRHAAAHSPVREPGSPSPRHRTNRQRGHAAEYSPESPRRSGRARPTQSMADLSHSDADDVDSDDEPIAKKPRSRRSPGQRKSAASGRTRPSRSMADLSHSYLDEVDSDDEPIAKKPRSRRSPAQRKSAASGRTRPSRSMADLSHSDVDEVDSDDEPIATKPPSRRSPAKRKSAASSPAKARKKSKTNRRKATASVDLPELKEWPDIDLKRITEVATAVVERMSDLDEDDMFAIPVTEAFPDIEQAYSARIETPMDFRTILEDRLPMYRSIQELQEDLILVFRNCVEFNGANTAYGAVAIGYWHQLNDIFRVICTEKDVLLPRRW